MKKITIGGKEYTFKFSVAASLYNECTETILNGFVTGGKIEAYAKNNDMNETMKEVVSTFTNIPQKAITLFYAGLLEYHSNEVTSMQDAQALVGQYLAENRDENGDWKLSFYDVFSEMMQIMAEDNFFGLIGLDKMIEQAEPKKKSTKKKTSPGVNG